MRALTLLVTCLLSASTAHALSCLEPAPRLWTPGPAVAAEAFVVVDAMRSELEELSTPGAHFIDAAGTPVALKVTRVGRQAVVRPARPLKGKARLVLPKHWPTLEAWPIKAPTPAAAWAADPKVTDAQDRDMGMYGRAWHRVIKVPAPGAALVQVSFPQRDGAPAVHYLPVQDGSVRLASHPCDSGVGGLLLPGAQQITLRLVGPGGVLGQARTLEVQGPLGGKRLP